MDHAALPTARSHWSNDSKAPGLARSDMSDSARCRRPMLHVSTAPTRYHVRVRTCAADQQTKACVLRLYCCHFQLGPSSLRHRIYLVQSHD